MAQAQDMEAAAADGRRTCIVTRCAQAPDKMIRFVLDPTGRVVPDLRRRLPGRGVWVTASAELVSRAVAVRGFSRGFKTPVEASPDLAKEIDELLERDALQSLSFVNKAGLVVTGSTKVEAAIERELPAALVQARDGGADGARKLRQATVRRWDAAGAQLPWIDMFESTQLDLALGRSNVIHGLLKRGSASASFLARWRRLAQYRGLSASEPGEENASRAKPVGDDGSVGARRE
jgi:uncharacterized protein